MGKQTFLIFLEHVYLTVGGQSMFMINQLTGQPQSLYLLGRYLVFNFGISALGFGNSIPVCLSVHHVSIHLAVANSFFARLKPLFISL